MMIKKLQMAVFKTAVLSLFFIGWMNTLSAQELNCTVNVNDRQISGSTYDYVSELRGDIEEYLNGRRWTDDRYEEHERIGCNIQVVLTSADSQFNFTAEVVFSLRRPIYNTNQQSVTMVISDSNWRFDYPRNRNLIHDELQFDELTSFLDFYAYVMIGLDYDTFSELGGSTYLNRARNIFELGQNAGTPGWGRSIGAQRNRYGLINDLTGSAYQDLRVALYQYHRLGLDQFTLDPDLSREEVMEALELIRETKRLTSNNYLFDLFFGTKYTEITALFRDADQEKRNRAYNLLRDADPAHTGEYQRLQN